MSNAKEVEMLDAINTARARHGLPAVVVDARLARAARVHAADMAQNPGLVHEGSDGLGIGERIAAQGYPAERYLEAVGWGWDGSAARMVEWWLNSPGHRHIILGDLPHAGVGYAYNPDTAWKTFWTIDFGRTGVLVPETPENAGNGPFQQPAGPFTANLPIVAAGAGGAIDLLPYMRGDGRLYEVRHANGATETFQTQTEGDVFYTVKNSQWEQLRADGEFIWRGLDTSPGEGRFYRQYEDGRDMARWTPRFMRPGQSWTGPGHNVQFYDKATCTPDPRNSGRATNRMLFVAHHRSAVWNGVQVEDLVELQGAGGERFHFARGYGLIAWGSDWGRSAICATYAPGERPNLVREVIRCL